MKNPIILIIALSIIIFASIESGAQNIDSKKYNYLVLSGNIEQLNPVLLTAKELAEEDGKKYGEFYVIFCGKTVTDIPGNNEFIKRLAKAKAQNVKVYACGLSLNKFNINAEQLPNGLEITKNGILYGFQLKKKGFITLSI